MYNSEILMTSHNPAFTSQQFNVSSNPDRLVLGTTWHVLVHEDRDLVWALEMQLTTSSKSRLSDYIFQPRSLKEICTGLYLQLWTWRGSQRYLLAQTVSASCLFLICVC